MIKTHLNFEMFGIYLKDYFDTKFKESIQPNEIVKFHDMLSYGMDMNVLIQKKCFTSDGTNYVLTLDGEKRYEKEWSEFQIKTAQKLVELLTKE